MAVFPQYPLKDKILVVDVSHHQDSSDIPGDIDFEEMKRKGVSGVIIKYSQGTVKDSKFEVSFNAAKRAGLPIGAYHYYDNRVDPKRQADRFILDLPAQDLSLGIWLDIEDRKEGMYPGWKNWYDMLIRLQTKFPNVGIYTGYFYWKENTLGKSIPYPALNWFRQFPLWLAWYHLPEEQLAIPLPWDKNDLLLWQWTDLLDGKSYGVESIELDGNYFMGTDQEWEYWTGYNKQVNTETVQARFGDKLIEYRRIS